MDGALDLAVAEQGIADPAYVVRGHHAVDASLDVQDLHLGREAVGGAGLDPRHASLRDNLETPYRAISDGAIAMRIPKHARKELKAYLDCGHAELTDATKAGDGQAVGAASADLTPEDFAARGWECRPSAIPGRVACSRPNQGFPALPPADDRPPS